MKQKWIRRLLIVQLLWAALACSVLAAFPERLTPVGRTAGIRLEADGLVIVGFDEEGSAARDAGLRKGDIIKTVNGERVHGCDEFKKSVAASKGDTLTLGALRGGREITAELKPVRNGTVWQLGVLLRDGMAGIGTVTFYDGESGIFGALGHGVNEPQSTILLPLEWGEILPSRVVEVQRGEGGAPGILKGAFETERPLGEVEENTEHGVFGHSSVPLGEREPVPVAARGEVHTGEASILSNIEGEKVDSYAVEITKLFPGEQSSGRNLLLTITDPRLLRTTGGIVQGMSGSPILQDGRIVGAVTHVLVDNPTQG